MELSRFKLRGSLSEVGLKPSLFTAALVLRGRDKKPKNSKLIFLTRATRSTPTYLVDSEASEHLQPRIRDKPLLL
jgi:hypothetical protein